MEEVLIIGGAGFIGSHIADVFDANNYKTIIVDNLSKGSMENIKNLKNSIFYNLDMLDLEGLEKVFKKHNIKYVFHEAAQISVSESIKDPINDANQNILGLLNVLKLSVKYKIKKLIFASSAAVYGIPETELSNENDKLAPLSFYGLTKQMGEQYIKLYNSLFSLDYVILRYSNVYGERQSTLGEAGVVAIFSDNLKNNKDIFIDGDGLQTRDFIYVKDVAYANYTVAVEDVKNEVFNVSNNSKTSIKELSELMKNEFNSKGNIVYREPRIGDIRDSRLDNTKLLTYTSYKPKFDINEGIKQYVRGIKCI